MSAPIGTTSMSARTGSRTRSMPWLSPFSFTEGPNEGDDRAAPLGVLAQIPTEVRHRERDPAAFA